MDRLVMAEMMVTLYQLYDDYPAGGFVCIDNDRTLVLYGEVDGILTTGEAAQLMAYAVEGSYAATT